MTNRGGNCGNHCYYLNSIVKIFLKNLLTMLLSRLIIAGVKPHPMSKPLRNRALFEQHRLHPELSCSELADLFSPLSRQRVAQIIKREEKRNGQNL